MKGAPSLEPSKVRKSFTLFFILYSLSRLTFALMGLRFSTEHVPSMMHFIDLELLHDRLLESLLYLHSQPPLMSLLMGSLLKVFGEHYPIAMQSLFLLIGLRMGFVVIDWMARMDFGPKTGLGLALLISLWPSLVVYQSYWFYTFPLSALILECGRAFWMAQQEPRFSSWFRFFSWLAVLCLLKSIFHLAFMVAVLGIVLFRQAHPRRALLAFGIPFLVAASWYGKNAIVFDRFASSSWRGIGLARKTYHQFPESARFTLVGEKILPPVCAVPIFGPVEDFEQALGPSNDQGIPLLDSPRKSNGWINYHHRIYLEASAHMEAAALRIIREQPEIYIQNVRQTLARLFIPSTHWEPVKTPYTQLRNYCDSVDAVVFARLWGTGLNPWALLAIILFLGLPCVRGATKTPSPNTGPSKDFIRLYVFILFVMGYVWALAVLLDTHETPRFRLTTDPLMMVGLALLAKSLRLGRFRPRLRGSQRVAKACPLLASHS